MKNLINKKPLIEVSHLHKEFGKGNKKVIAIEDSTFSIYEGENLAILGANGAGKTTTAEILAGLAKADRGKILYHLGTDSKHIHQKIGIQFQDSNYPNGISVKGIIKFVINAFGVKISKEELQALLKVFGISNFYSKNAASLSGGQAQRLNVLLALIHKPKVLFLDELSTGLDVTIRTEIKEFVRQYAIKHKITLVLISHDMNEVEYLADRIIIMKHGKIIVEAYKKKVLKDYPSLESFVKNYI